MLDYTLLTLMIIFFAGVTSALQPSSKKLGFWFCVSIIILLSSLRAPHIGNDTPNYIYIFNNLDPENSSRYEIGYIWLNNLIRNINDNYQVLFTVVSVIIYGSFGRFIMKYSKLPWLSLFLFFTYGFFTFTFTALRQGLAMVICLFAFEAIMNNRNVKAILLIIIATLFHSTAIVFFVAFLCKVLKPSTKTFIIGYIIAFVLLAVFTAVLNYVFQLLPMYEHYTSGTYIGDTGTAAYLYTTLSTGILIFSYINLRQYNGRVISLSKVDSFGLIMILFAIMLYIISINANIFDRMAIYFNTLAIIVLPNAITHLKGATKQLSIVCVLLVFYIYEAIIITYRPEWISIYPYSFYWQK